MRGSDPSPKIDHNEATFPKQDIRFRKIYSVSKDYFADCIKRGVPFHDLLILKNYAEADLQLIDETKPRIIIGDFRFSLNISTTARKIPLINLTNAHWTPELPKPWATLENPWTHRFVLPLTTSIANFFGKQAFFARCLRL